MYPLKDFHKVRRTLRFKTPYPKGFGSLSGQPHLGVDYVVPVGTPLHAFYKTVEVVRSFHGTQGGNTAWVKCEGKLVRFLHLRELPKLGVYKAGEVFAYTGNTGVSTAPHTHSDVSTNGTLALGNMKNFEDPDEFFEKMHVKYEKELQAIEDKKKKEPVVIKTEENKAVLTETKEESKADIPLEPKKVDEPPKQAPDEILQPRPEEQAKNKVESLLILLIRGVVNWFKK